MTTLADRLDEMLADQAENPGVGGWFRNPRDPVFAALVEVARAAEYAVNGIGNPTDNAGLLSDALTALEAALEANND